MSLVYRVVNFIASPSSPNYTNVFIVQAPCVQRLDVLGSVRPRDGPPALRGELPKTPSKALQMPQFEVRKKMGEAKVMKVDGTFRD